MGGCTEGSVGKAKQVAPIAKKCLRKLYFAIFDIQIYSTKTSQTEIYIDPKVMFDFILKIYTIYSSKWSQGNCGLNFELVAPKQARIIVGLVACFRLY